MARRAPTPCPRAAVKPTPPPAPPAPPAVAQEAEPGLPDKPTYRVSEVAYYYSVTEQTVRTWLAHSLLESEPTPGGQVRITRESLNSFRFRRLLGRSGSVGSKKVEDS